MSGMLGGWRNLLLVGFCAFATVAATDAALQTVVPLNPLLEVDSAILQYAAGDPTVLVVGSSHARSFVALGRALYERTHGEVRVQSVPVEWGKLTNYAWVLENRIKPLIEARTSSGALRRPSLRHVLIVTEWWDSTSQGNGTSSITMGLPARAWRWRDFLADLCANNLNNYNRNFLQKIWRELWPKSILVQDRGHDRIIEGLRASISRKAPSSAKDPKSIEFWQAMIEGGEQSLFEPSQMKAFDELVSYFKGRDLDVTLLLYPRMPGTLTQKAKDTTLRQFSQRMRAIAQEKGIRFVDITASSPLTDDDFAPDLDHVLPDGNERLAAWALAGDLSFLAGAAQ